MELDSALAFKGRRSKREKSSNRYWIIGVVKSLNIENSFKPDHDDDEDTKANELH